MAPKQSTSGFWAILASAIIYGAYGCLARLLNGSFGYYTQVLFRSSVALFIVLGILAISKTAWKLTKRDLIKVFVLGLSFFAGVTLFTMGSVLDKISVVLFVFYAGSFATSFVVSTFYYHEKVTMQKSVALTMVLLGLVVTTGFNFSHLSWGLFAAIASGVFDAFANNLRKQLAVLPKMQVLLIQFAITSLLALGALWITQETSLKEVTSVAIGAGIVWGLFWIIGNQLIMIGYKQFDFMLAQIVLSSEIFFATILAFLFFQEIPTMYELVGGLLIFVGVCLVEINFSKLQRVFFHKKKLL